MPLRPPSQAPGRPLRPWPRTRARARASSVLSPATGSSVVARPPRARLSSVAEVRTCQEDTIQVSSVPPPRARLFSVETAADQETCETALVSDTGGRQIPGMSMTMSEMSKVSRKSKVTKHSSPMDLAGCEVDGEGVTPGRQRGAAPSRGVRRLPAFPREVIEAPVSNSASRQNACAEESQRPRAALLDKAFSDHLPSGAES